MRIAVLILLAAMSTDCRRKRAQAESAAPAAASPDADRDQKGSQPLDVPVFDADAVRSELRVVASVNGAPLSDGMTCETLVYLEGSRRDPVAVGPCGSTLRFIAGTRDAYAVLRAGALSTEKRLPTETYGKEGKTVVVDFDWAVGRARASHAADPAISQCRVQYMQGSKLALEAAAGEMVSLEVGEYTPVFKCTLAAGGTLTVSGAALQVSAGKDALGEFRLNLGTLGAAFPTSGAVDSGAKNSPSTPGSGTPPPPPTGENRPREPDAEGAPSRELAPQNYKENP